MTTPKQIFVVQSTQGKTLANYFSNASPPRIGEKIDLRFLQISGIYVVVDLIHSPRDIEEIPYQESLTSRVTLIKIIVAEE